MPRLLLKHSGSMTYYRLQDQALAAQTQGAARLIWAFSKKRKDCGYALMARTLSVLYFINPSNQNS
jgi:hypothetical protein